MQRSTSHSSAASRSHPPFPRVPGGVRLSSLSLGGRGCMERGGRTLTLSADGPLPAFFADTREGLAVDHTGAPVVAGARQAATISGCKTKNRQDLRIQRV